MKNQGQVYYDAATSFGITNDEIKERIWQYILSERKQAAEFIGKQIAEKHNIQALTIDMTPILNSPANSKTKFINP